MSRLASQNRLLVLFTLLALAVKAMVPAGFMLGTGLNGETIISLCSADGNREVYYNAATNAIRELTDTTHDSSADHGAQVCPFSTLMHAAIAAPMLAGPSDILVRQQSFALPKSRIGHSTRPRGRAEPRAPPARSFL